MLVRGDVPAASAGCPHDSNVRRATADQRRRPRYAVELSGRQLHRGNSEARLPPGARPSSKVPEECPGPVVELVEALYDAGIPRNVVSLVFGAPAEISTFLLGENDVKILSFTGSKQGRAKFSRNGPPRDSNDAC